jgi:hypothetical protein
MSYLHFTESIVLYLALLRTARTLFWSANTSAAAFLPASTPIKVCQSSRQNTHSMSGTPKDTKTFNYSTFNIRKEHYLKRVTTDKKVLEQVKHILGMI